jgi:hypothetical protein
MSSDPALAPRPQEVRSVPTTKIVQASFAAVVSKCIGVPVSVHGDVAEGLIMKARGVAKSNGCKARIFKFPHPGIDLFCIFACGILWRKEAFQDAGRELLQALSSPNAIIRRVAKSMLDERTIVRCGAESRRGSPPLASRIEGAGNKPCLSK